MGRPSLAEQRRQEILQAAAQSVAMYGLAASTQERIAAVAGMSRSHIRHYVGNRDDLIDALWEHIMTPHFASMHAVLADRDSDAQLTALVDFLFGPKMARDEDNAVIEALISGAMQDLRLRARIYDSYSRLEREIAAVIRAAIPGSSSSESLQLAYALICIAFGHSTLSALPFPPSRRRGAKELAHQMLEGLRNAAGDRATGATMDGQGDQHGANVPSADAT